VGPSVRPGCLFVRCPRVRVPERVARGASPQEFAPPRHCPLRAAVGGRHVLPRLLCCNPTSRHQAAHSTSALSPAQRLRPATASSTGHGGMPERAPLHTTKAFGPASSAVDRWAPERVSEVRSPRHQKAVAHRSDSSDRWRGDNAPCSHERGPPRSKRWCQRRCERGRFRPGI
jgi:hypothetical protein